MSDQNKAMVRRSIEEVWNGGNFAAVETFAASDMVIHGSHSTGDIVGPAGVRQFFGALRNAFPDLRFTVEDQISEADRVVTRWSAQGTHKGEFQGIPPTGKQCDISGVDIDRVVNGKIIECWSNFDELGLLQQLGVVPEPGSTVHQ